MPRGRARDASERRQSALVRIQSAPLMVNAQVDATSVPMGSSQNKLGGQIPTPQKPEISTGHHQPPNYNLRSNAKLEALVRFIEELIDVLNFGNTINK
jgi:hypothetical protein